MRQLLKAVLGNLKWCRQVFMHIKENGERTEKSEAEVRAKSAEASATALISSVYTSVIKSN